MWCPFRFPHKTMFGSSLPPVVCRRYHALFTLFVFVYMYWCTTHVVAYFWFAYMYWCTTHAAACFCFVCLYWCTTHVVACFWFAYMYWCTTHAAACFCFVCLYWCTTQVVACFWFAYMYWCTTHAVACFCFVCFRLVSCVSYVVIFSGLSIFDCPLVFSNICFQMVFLFLHSNPFRKINSRIKYAAGTDT